MKVFGIILFLIVSQVSSASVWSSDKEWDDQWQERYANWISVSVGPRFFKELGKPFSDLKIDCADAHYGLMAYFARENGLHMAVNRGNTTNKTTRFDHISDSNKRLVAFINFLSGSYGTESLSHNDTYPVGIRDIQAGDLFMYKTGGGTEVIRHAYIIKNINVDGTFKVMYSTQARRDDGRPLKLHESYMFKKAPFNQGVDKNHWGFRRAKNSSEAGVSQEDLFKSDFSQYDLAFNMLNTHGFTNGKLAFFREVRRLNRTINESPNRVAQRNFDNTCAVVKDRVQAVQSGVDHNNKLGGRCMNFSDYDAYSTPSRDSGIMDDYRNYLADVNAVDQNRLNNSNKNLFNAVFRQGGPDQSEVRSLLRACAVNTSVGQVELGSFREKLFSDRVSFHPNDNIYRRWGFERGDETRCEAYYGYPTN